MIEIPTNAESMNKVENAVNEVMSMLTTGADKYGEGKVGTAYLDWGIVSDTYKNCPSKRVADKVGRIFKDKGYYVYYQVMGFGNRRIAEGTPICLRIQDFPHNFNNWVRL